MRDDPLDTPRLDDPKGKLERAFIDEFLRAKGVDRQALEAMPEEERHALLRDASVYAATKLTEVESRAHYVQDIHGTE